jgi:hypothetical protein
MSRHKQRPFLPFDTLEPVSEVVGMNVGDTYPSHESLHCSCVTVGLIRHAAKRTTAVRSAHIF